MAIQPKQGYCQDPDCEDSTEKGDLYFYHTANNPEGIWICDGCIEVWAEENEIIRANATDMREAGYNTGSVLWR